MPKQITISLDRDLLQRTVDRYPGDDEPLISDDQRALMAAFQAALVEGDGGEGHRVEIEFDGLYPSVRLLHPASGCPEGEEGEACWLTDWLENEGAELLRGTLTLPVRWEQDLCRDHPLFHLPATLNPKEGQQ